jgi:hypothetical protein
MGKIMPEEAIQDMTRAERILAHYQDNYELHEDDRPYFDMINVAFKVIHADEDRDLSRRKLNQLFPQLRGKKMSRLIADVAFVYGEFYDINRQAMRIIQEKRHERVYESAMRAGEYAAAERALKAIDELHRLYEHKADLPNVHRKLKKVRRTTDPAALDQLKKDSA